jgi:ABC-2 type transport system permease protein
MTTTSPAPVAPAAAAPAAAARPSFAGLLASEWTKIRSVRSTAWTLIIFVVITLGFTGLFTWLTAANWNGPKAGPRDARVAIDPVAFILGAGLGLGQLTLCVLGVLVITTEYSTGVIRSSLLAVPRRLWMLAAKCVVFAVLLFVLGEIISFGSFFIGSSILHSHVQVSLSDHNVTRAVLGSGLYLTVLGLFSLAIGGIIRHTAGAITTAIGVVFVLPILAGLLPSSWGAHVNGYLPEQAGTLIGQAQPPAGGNVLSAWEGFGVFCLWAVVLLAIAAYLLRKRDA